MKLEDLVVLYAEDELSIAQNVIDVLEMYVKKVHYAKDGAQLLEIYKECAPDILLLDISMPKLDGLSALRLIRQSGHKTQVIVLTARSEQNILLLAVEQFITKYIIKPFDKTTLISALEACLHNLNSEILNIPLAENLSYNPQNYTLKNQEMSIKLSKKEGLLLEILLKHSPKVTTYQEIKNYVWKSGYCSEDALKSAVKELRKKLNSGALKNISGIGYILNLEDN